MNRIVTLLICLNWGIYAVALQRKSPAEDFEARQGNINRPSSVITKSLRAFPCPNATDILPCECGVNTASQMIIDCSNVTSNEELNSVFLKHFPVTEFFLFSLFNNDNVTQLQANCFQDISFERIEIYNTPLNLVSQYALDSSANTLSYLFIRIGQLSDSTFPWHDLARYTKLDFVNIDYHDPLTWLPPLTSDAITTLRLSDSSIAALAPGR